LAIVEALAADLTSGVVAGGTQLLPQREMAERLGLSVGTVARAYAEAGRRGLISGEVGRGSFVRAGGPLQPEVAPPRPVNMSLNVAPDTGAGPLIAAAIAAQAGQITDLLDYLPHVGVKEHRAAMTAWLAEGCGLAVPVERVALCNGAQHGIALAMMAALEPGDAVLAEAVTYPGLLGIAARLGHALHPVPMDALGILPDALDAAFAATGARALYCMPRLQTPTGAVMDAARRDAVVAVLRRHHAWAIEDDVYAFLAPDLGPPLAALAPERVCHVSSLAKCLAPGLRVGALVTPDSLRARVNGALRATAWMASPILTALAATLIGNGAAADQALRKRRAAAERWDLALAVMSDHISPPSSHPAFHLWLPLAGPPAPMVAEAALLGVVLSPPSEVPGPGVPRGIRLCLGGAADLDELGRALAVVTALLEQGGGRAFL
jgi:DNA-binding transcriptional MocR family regulator